MKLWGKSPEGIIRVKLRPFFHCNCYLCNTKIHSLYISCSNLPVATEQVDREIKGKEKDINGH